MRREGLRGQAWIIYEDVQSSTAALQAEQGFTFFGKDLKLQYARETSDRIAKRDGTYVPKAKRQKLKQLEAAAKAPAGAGGAAASSQGDDAAAASAAEVAQPPPPAPPTEQPSHILFAKDLPSEVNEMMLSMLFRQYAGFKEVRIPRQGLAFCEFDDEPHATLALEALNGFKLTTTDALKLTYGKK